MAQLEGLAGKLIGGSLADSNASAPDMAQFISNYTLATRTGPSLGLSKRPVSSYAADRKTFAPLSDKILR